MRPHVDCLRSFFQLGRGNGRGMRCQACSSASSNGTSRQRVSIRHKVGASKPRNSPNLLLPAAALRTRFSIRMALSPDGNRFVYALDRNGCSRIVVELYRQL